MTRIQEEKEDQFCMPMTHSTRQTDTGQAIRVLAYWLVLQTKTTLMITLM